MLFNLIKKFCAVYEKIPVQVNKTLLSRNEEEAALF
jgi:hypothetical protein